MLKKGIPDSSPFRSSGRIGNCDRRTLRTLTFEMITDRSKAGGLLAARSTDANKINLLLLVEVRERQRFLDVVVGFGSEEVFEVGLDWDGLVLLQVDLAVDGHAGACRDE